MQHVQDIVEASVQDSPKLNESRQEPVDIPSQNESTQVRLPVFYDTE